MDKVKKKKRKKRKKSKNYILRIFIVLCILACIYGILHIEYFTVDKVSVKGTDFLTSEEVLKDTKIQTGKNIFDIHVSLEKRKILKNPYIETAKVSRELPNKIKVVITEKTAMAQFKAGSKYVVTDNEGTVLENNKKQKNITLVEGFVVSKAETGSTIITKNDDKLQDVLELLKVTDEGDMYFKYVRLVEGRVTAGIYGDLKVTGTYENVIDSLKSGTLKTVVYDLYQKDTKKGTIKVSGDNYCSFTEK